MNWSWGGNGEGRRTPDCTPDGGGGKALSVTRRVLLSLTAAVAMATSSGVAAGQPADTLPRSRDPLFTNNDAAAAGLFAIATIAAFPLDKVFADYAQGAIQERRFIRRIAVVVEEIAEPGALIIGATFYGVGKATGNEEMADLGLHGTEAIVVGMVVTTAIKGLAGRARPYLGRDDPHAFKLARGFRNEDYRSFPSGHTLIGFAAAAAVTEETRRFWPNAVWIIGPAMYGGATLIGLSRMYDNKHWASDVIMGAAIGVFSGRKVVRYHHTHPGNSLDRWLLGVSITPSGPTGYAWRPIIAPTR